MFHSFLVRLSPICWVIIQFNKGLLCSVFLDSGTSTRNEASSNLEDQDFKTTDIELRAFLDTSPDGRYKRFKLILRPSRYLAQKVLPQCGGTCCVYTFLYFHSWIATKKFDRVPFIVACHHLAHLTSKAYELFMPKNLIYLAPMVLCFPSVAAPCKSFIYLRLVLGLSLFVFFTLFLVLTMSLYCPNLS